MAAHGFMEPVTWHASLPGVIVSAAAIVGDGSANVLIVKPNYRDYWTLPGGICEFGEPPHAGCAREVSEELGVQVPIGRLLAVDWQLPPLRYGASARPAVFFLFDAGTLPSGSDISLQADELDDWRFAAESELPGFLSPAVLPRVSAAIAALPSGCTRYVPADDGGPQAEGS